MNDDDAVLQGELRRARRDNMYVRAIWHTRQIELYPNDA